MKMIMMTSNKDDSNGDDDGVDNDGVKFWWRNHRELKQGRRQLQRCRQKTMIWLVEWGKIIVLHVLHNRAARAARTLIHWRNLPNDNVKFPNLRF